MQVFYADQRKAKLLYQSTKRHYKRWMIGNIVCFIFLLCIVGIYQCVVDAVGQGFTFEALVVGTGVAIVPFIIALMFHAFAVSGGRETLLNRFDEKVTLTDRYLSMEYVPHIRETFLYIHVKYHINYWQIEKLEYQKKKGRIKITGEYKIKILRRPRFQKDEGNEVEENISNGTFYIYEQFNDFDTLRKQLFVMAGKLDDFE